MSNVEPPPAPRQRRIRQGDFRTSLVRKGVRRAPVSEVYLWLIERSWPELAGLVVGLYGLSNLVFAGLYLAGGDTITNARPGSFVDAYFFSVQTLATIGYGGMTPHGLYANVLVAFESLYGLVLVALMTGIVYSKFSRPNARILFAERAVVHVRDGVPTLTFRVANERANNVVEASMTVTSLQEEVTKEGRRMRRIRDLHLSRSKNPVFVLSWSVMHAIDEKSPLYGLDQQQLIDRRVRVICTITGLEAAFGQTVHATHAYEPEDLFWDHDYVDVITVRADGVTEIDLTKFHEVKPMTSAT
jgi:inward rectifier potassium channel